MRSLFAVLAVVLSFTALDAHAQRYAVISLIGDRMQLAYARGVDGQPVDRIERRYIPLDDSSIDRATLGKLPRSHSPSNVDGIAANSSALMFTMPVTWVVAPS